MYYCETCGGKFEAPQKSYETHGFSSPPYEKVYSCPFCNSADFVEVEYTHCRCCGALLVKSQIEYCSTSCKLKGEKLWKRQKERFKNEYESPINIILREIKKYNLKNGTSYSYGQYVSLELLERKNKKCTRTKSNI